jgi:hypothetical protein
LGGKKDEEPIDALSARFPARLIRQVEKRGKSLDYIPGSAIIARLNEVFGTDWNYEILKLDIGQAWVVARARITYPGGHKDGVGGAQIKMRRDGNGPVDVSDDAKAATTDALKRCAMLLGVGLHLYSDGDTDNGPGYRDDRPPPRQEDRRERPANSSPGTNGRSASGPPGGECDQCGHEIPTTVASYSRREFGRYLCRPCQDDERRASPAGRGY